MNALKAKVFYRRDVQYTVRNGKAIIINEVLSDFNAYNKDAITFAYAII
jgi:preprotein translocase subunit SecA